MSSGPFGHLDEAQICCKNNSNMSSPINYYGKSVNKHLAYEHHYHLSGLVFVSILSPMFTLILYQLLGEIQSLAL